MTYLLGWVPADTPAPESLDVALLPYGAVAYVVHRDSLAAEAALSHVQACYRAFDAYLPHIPGQAEPSESEILSNIAALAGHGQLRLQISQPERTEERPPVTGRGFLRARHRQKAATAAWQASATETLITLTACLAPKARRLTECADRLIVDLLIPKTAEAALYDRLRTSIADPVAPPLKGANVTASGLWAPLAFIGREPCTNG